MDQGYVKLAIMVDDNGGNRIPSTETLAAWADRYGVAHPVTADTTGYDASSYINGGYPTYVLIDQTMTIIDANMFPVNETLVRAIVENPPE